MTNLTYEHICSATGCKFHVVWDFGHGDCYSCRKIGESYHVTEYPQDCPFRSEMQRCESEAEDGFFSEGRIINSNIAGYMRRKN